MTFGRLHMVRFRPVNTRHTGHLDSIGRWRSAGRPVRRPVCGCVFLEGCKSAGEELKLNEAVDGGSTDAYDGSQQSAGTKASVLYPVLVPVLVEQGISYC